MASEKTVNYTEAQTAELVEAYKAEATEATVKMFAEKFGKTTRSIVAKLSREGVYEAKAKAKGEGAAKAATKADLIKRVEKALEIEPGTLESLEKGSKSALEALVAAVAEA
jgi:hypothetical protein